MDSRAKLMGHSLHRMLVVFPLGLFLTAVSFDLIGLAIVDPEWHGVSFYLIGAGIVGGFFAGAFGLFDLSAIPHGTRAWRVGVAHGTGMAVVITLFTASWLLRRNAPSQPTDVEIALSSFAVLLLVVTGWLGAELVERLGVGVAPRAGLDAPSSLTHLPEVPAAGPPRLTLARGPLGHARANIDVPLLRGPRA
jgi:uncharacterized membrane protein